MIAVVPREGMRDEAMREVEALMRIRHKLNLEQPNDFDLATQDAVLKVWDQISRATFLALVVISSIALMVGGIGVMAIMMISVTERTREIGVRKALGARRREILWQFLIEAAFLTSAGGVIGIIVGSGIGLARPLVSGFPVSLPWWSFAIGIGFSASIGIFFGLFPAIKASRLDPIEALQIRVAVSQLRAASSLVRQVPAFQSSICLHSSREPIPACRNIESWQKAHALALAELRDFSTTSATDAWPLQDQLPRRDFHTVQHSRGAGRGSDPTFGDSCCTPWDPATNLSMISFLPGISGSCRARRIPGSRATRGGAAHAHLPC